MLEGLVDRHALLRVEGLNTTLSDLKDHDKQADCVPEYGKGNRWRKAWRWA